MSTRTLLHTGRLTLLRPAPRPRLPRQAPRVLMYHFFGDAPAGGDPKGLFVSRQAFAAQLEDLRRRGWRALSLDDYLAGLAGRPTPRRSFLVTIDDGHESVGRVAAPVLAAAGVPAVLFVCPGLLGGRARWTPGYTGERLAAAAELTQLCGDGVELGVHGFDHTRLAGLDGAALHRQVAAARAELAAVTGVAPRAFAYPYGTFDEAARHAVAAAGYDVGFAVAREGGRFAVDRVGVHGADSPRMFRFKLSPAYRLLSRTAGRTQRLRHRVREVVHPAGRDREAGWPDE
ncbi:polysaccharide deacetylase family protein [Pseudonocardia acidicola]|uniref:Polysaccharide deacetylase family protein n=1 Tax=Pseudonocardia acidicola TaxID=2724939 RepID=A0ABX1SFD8_9PSEU|nr:polysaccharide deacetylase family protein [Pseudonocardia acidicola]NMI00270.1 polysaccharide deacetylase family protein [Pseudonocardia acidicola]